MGTKVQVIPVEGEADLHCHFYGQTQAQGCYVELDCESGRLTADYNSEIGNAVPASVWHARTLRWPIQPMTAGTANALLEEVKPLAQIVLDGYESEWNGSNWVGHYTDEAHTAADSIETICEDAEHDLQVWDAGDWLDAVSNELGITAETTDAELEAMAADLLAEAQSDGVHVLEGLDRYLESLRSE